VKVIDSSVLCGALLGEDAAVDAMRGSDDDAMHCPALVELETLNALRSMERGGRIERRHAQQAVTALGEMRMVLYPHGPLRDRIWSLRHNLTAYDASYLALAELLDDSVLITSDTGLAQAARASLGDARVQFVG
jgi:predicted nucleic acid-binding protein